MAYKFESAKFPEWLGKNSSSRKIKREIRELRMAISEKISGNRFAIKFDYIPFLFKHIIKLLKKGKQNIEEAI